MVWWSCTDCCKSKKDKNKSIKMDQYLTSIREKLKDIKDKASVTFVIGNESCDLDSAVSAIVYAYFLNTKRESDDRLVVPMLNVAKVRN